MSCPVSDKLYHGTWYFSLLNTLLWCWRRLLGIPWTARRSNQSILKEINPEYSLKGLMLKLQHFGHLIQRPDSLEKTLMLGKTEDRRWRALVTEDEMVGWHHRHNGHEFEQALGDSEGQGSLTCYNSWGYKELDMTYGLNNNKNNQKTYKKMAKSTCLSIITLSGSKLNAPTKRHRVAKQIKINK